ncbi:bestrophin family ion channel [Stenotrophomonas sp. SBJS02]|uniref:bestrophin family ion channel n=1 Tax=Stenotrophomonas sp. SBJS02 TaxID=2599307 RepID=UPI002E212F4E
MGARGYSILRFHSRIRCCFTGLRSYSAQRFLLRWQERWGGGPFYRYSLWRTRFFGLDALGRQLEEPFSAAPNALPIYSMQRTIETELMSTLALTAVDHESVQQPGREG